MNTRMLLPDADGIAAAAAILRSGGRVAMPTETVYGLAANALDPVSVASIFDAKQRPSFDPLIVHLPDAASALGFAEHLPATAEKLAAAFWPGPLTLVLPRDARIPDIVAAELPTVALRVPAHPVARALLQASALPLAAPSANLFGSVSPTSAAHVLDGLGGRIEAVLDGGACALGLESTVVAFEGERPIILRHGAVTREALEQLCGEVGEGARVLERPLAPGQLARHYATASPLLRFATVNDLPGPDLEVVLIVVSGEPPAAHLGGYRSIFTLSPRGDLNLAAASLFGALREADALRPRAIHVLTCEEVGIGRASTDRLQRAAVAG